MEKGNDEGGEELLVVKGKAPVFFCHHPQISSPSPDPGEPVVDILFNVKAESFLNKSSLLQIYCLISGEFNL